MINHEKTTGGDSMNDTLDLSADILSSIDNQEKIEHQKLLETIEEARANGKEDFDPNVFSKLYWRQGLMRDGMENAKDESVVDSYIREYYMDNPDVMTMKDFAAKLEAQDEQLE